MSTSTQHTPVAPPSHTTLYRDPTQHCFGFLTLAELATCTRTCREWNAWVATAPTAANHRVCANYMPERATTTRSSLLPHVGEVFSSGLVRRHFVAQVTMFGKLHKLSVSVVCEQETMTTLSRIHTLQHLELMVWNMMPLECSEMSFGGLQQLTHLHTLLLSFMSYASLSTLQIAEICGILSLRVVDLPECFGTVKTDAAIGTALQQIAQHGVAWQTIGLHRIELTREHMRCIAQLAHLTHLQPISLEVDATTPAVPSLEHLHAFPSASTHTDDLLQWIGRHRGLRSLACDIADSFRVSHLHRVLATQPHLRKLAIRECVDKQDDALIRCLVQFPHLTHLSIPLTSIRAQLQALASMRLTRLLVQTTTLTTPEEDEQLRSYHANPTRHCRTLESFEYGCFWK